MATGIKREVQITEALADVVGPGPMPRTEIVKKLWVYIKKNNLQDPKNRRNIMVDEKLKKILGDMPSVTMMEMTKLYNKHILK